MSDALRKRLSAAEAARAILAEVEPLPAHSALLGEALGQVLARKVISPLDIPPWDNSAMDGYALRSGDLRKDGETVLDVVEEIAAGTFPLRTIGKGQCARIFTGAPVPEGADCVIRQEDTAQLKDRRVRITGSRDAGRNVRRRGEDIESGTVVFEPGTELSPSRIGVLASMAMAHVEVHRRPTVAILSTGDEIADLDEREAILTGRKIASSNSYAMRAALEQAGGVLLDLGIARDDPDDLERRLDRAADADLLVTSGGMSVGEHDHLRKMLELRGGDMKFWRLRTRPGAPVGFGLLSGVPWLGLPGNPVSTMVTFELFVRPAIRRLLGHTKPFRRAVSVRVEEALRTPASLMHFLRVQVSETSGVLSARLTGPQGSGMLSSMASADALLVVPEDVNEVAPGETLQAILLGESVHVEEAPY